MVASYRRVYLITPRAAEVPDALLAVAELFSEMGDRFGRNYYQSAVDAYEFLVHEYPASKYSQDALLRIGKLQREQLGDAAQAKKTYEDFLKKYPHSKRKLEAQEALAELALLQNSEKPAPAGNAPSTAKKEEPDAAEGGEVAPARTSANGVPRVRRIRASLNGEATRVTIDLEDTVQYSSAHIANPERIFFDLHTARLSPEVAQGNVEVEGKLLSAVRVAQNQVGVVRVVLYVKGVKDYTASLLNDPPRLVIDLYPESRRDTAVQTAKSKPTKKQTDEDESSLKAKSGAEDSGKTRRDGGKDGTPDPSGPTETEAGRNAASNGKTSGAKSAKTGGAKPDLIQPVKSPQPTRDGQSTLTRALGLKVGRIVIDPGHGGHDTGTIGPTGLMEKDLCLDVALRLGKIIQQRLPGAEVVYTRADDTFIPLEERTNIANESKADLFISIHANSSENHSARGVETYYLNLKGSPEAMEVAARENASSEEGVHDLEDLVKKIARNEKIDESREFAEDVQDSLSKRIQKSGRTIRNRGVRKAPFVVLIGADMPSILTEISFLSNPSDEQLLKKPEYRQRLAEGIYLGMANYLQSLNSVTMNLPGKSSSSNRPAGGASVEQSRNQR